MRTKRWADFYPGASRYERSLIAKTHDRSSLVRRRAWASSSMPHEFIRRKLSAGNVEALGSPFIDLLVFEGFDIGACIPQLMREAAIRSRKNRPEKLRELADCWWSGVFGDPPKFLDKLCYIREVIVHLPKKSPEHVRFMLFLAFLFEPVLFPKPRHKATFLGYIDRCSKSKRKVGWPRSLPMATKAFLVTMVNAIYTSRFHFVSFVCGAMMSDPMPVFVGRYETPEQAASLDNAYPRCPFLDILFENKTKKP